MTYLETLERRQLERIQHFHALEQLIERRQREIDNLRARSNPTVRKLQAV